uniref:Putative cytochrome c oxidase assembly factor n=1 Tax=Trypanosoma congolense (strain IL3000) TaxID=1068625 RepID=G0UIX6_TRYCI|nr:putative cytochrome c oxidase assembly factor [Trypanosoma congolense IL3000]
MFPLRRKAIPQAVLNHARFISFSGEQRSSQGGFFSVLRHGPRSRAEFLGLCLGCAVFPLSLYLTGQYDKPQPPQLPRSFNKTGEPDSVGSKYPLGGPFRLRESRTGEYITDEELFHNHWTLFYFGFSKCAEVCPTTLRFITEVMKACERAWERNEALAPELEKLQAVFLSVDSRRDTPEVLEKFVSKYGPRVRGLTGTTKEVEQAARAWRVYYSTVEETDEERQAREAKGVPAIEPDDDTYQLDHSSAIYLVGVTEN